MKKFIIYILCILLLFSAVSCTPGGTADTGGTENTTGAIEDTTEAPYLGVEGYEALYEDHSMSEIYIKGEMDSPELCPSLNKNPSALIEPEKINYLGKTYDVKAREYDSGIWHYDYESENEEITFKVNENNGLIVEYDWVPKNGYNPTTPELTQEECVEIGTDYLSEFTDGAEKYWFKVRLDTDNVDYDNVYVIYFNMRFGNIITREDGRIWVTTHGDVVHHNFNFLGTMVDAASPTDRIPDIETTLDAKVRNLCREISKEYEYTYEKNLLWYVRTKDNRYGFRYAVTLTLTPRDNSKRVETTSMTIGVYWNE